MLAEVEAGWPSAVTAGPRADGVELDAAEIRERMSGNLCRCGAYVNIVAGDRWTRRREGVRLRARRPTPTGRSPRGAAPEARASWRRHQPRRPDAARRGDARAARRRDRGCRRPASSETAGGGLRIGAARPQQRPRRRTPPSARATRCSPQALLAGASGPAAQPRDRRRQPAAAHPLPLLPGRHASRATSASRARAARPSRASTTTSPSSATRTHCVATHPSDMAVALAALDAVVHVRGPAGARAIPMPGFHRLPGDEPERDTDARARRADHRGRAAAAATPRAAPPTARCASGPRSRSRSSRWRPRSRCATAPCDDVRLALGGVAHAPWRAERAEAALRGAPATAEAFARGGRGRARRARPLRDNAYKVPLARNADRRARSRELAGAAVTATVARAVGAPRRPRRGPREGHRARRRTPPSTDAERRRLRAGSCRRRSPAAASAPSTPARRSALPGVLAVLWHGNAPDAARASTTASCAVLQSRPRRLPRPVRRRRRRRHARGRARGRARSCASTYDERAARRRAARRPPAALHAGEGQRRASRPTPRDRRLRRARLRRGRGRASTRRTRTPA